MGHQRATPDSALSGIVDCYWGMDRDLSAVGGFDVTPDPFVENPRRRRSRQGRG